MPRLAAACLLAILLAGCAEVTTFRKPDGSVYHMATCSSFLRLESCSHAAKRICPAGYTVLEVGLAIPDGAVQQEDSERVFACR